MLDKALITVCIVILTRITYVHDNGGGQGVERGDFVMIMSGEDIHGLGLQCGARY